MAMAKLYPPIIGPTLPAFYQNDDNTLTVTVPFKHNRAVSNTDYSGIVLRLKTVQNDFVCFENTIENINIPVNGGTLIFKIPQIQWQKNAQQWYVNNGQYYKAQIAYIQKETRAVGYYSTVGMTKFTVYPEVSIENLSEKESNPLTATFRGLYKQIMYDTTGNIIYGDMTEKVYSYKFILQNAVETIDTGWLIHDSTTDIDSFNSFDTFEYLKDFGGSYKIQYIVQTNSGLEIKSPVYDLESPEMDIYDYFEVKLNFDDGYVSIPTEGKAGAYVIRENNYEKVKIHKIKTNETEFRDNTIEQGKKYIYYICFMDEEEIKYIQVNKSNSIIVDFEDIFLSDAQGRQLKIRFNPTVNGNKINILEQKVNTLGGKYPIFLKSGNTYYYEFSLGGLISYHMDENGLFYATPSEADYIRTSTMSNDAFEHMTARERFYYERIFRDEVYKWLINGEPKLYRSQAEGNKIVRINNCSLAPYNVPGRLVYTFNSTVTEIDEHDDNAMKKYGFYDLEGGTIEKEFEPIEKTYAILGQAVLGHMVLGRREWK